MEKKKFYGRFVTLRKDRTALRFSAKDENGEFQPVWAEITDKTANKTGKSFEEIAAEKDVKYDLHVAIGDKKNFLDAIFPHTPYEERKAGGEEAPF